MIPELSVHPLHMVQVLYQEKGKDDYKLSLVALPENGKKKKFSEIKKTL